MKEVTLVNEDGTSMDDFPKNPLEEKWAKLYPPIPNLENCQVCDGYSCMWCGRCPNGEYWEVPEEDKEVWEQYDKQRKAYFEKHNPNIVKHVNEILNEIENSEKQKVKK